MVIIKNEDKLPRLRWKKGVITDRNNNVRGAVVCVVNNKGKIITIIPLELAKNIKDNDSKCTDAVGADVIQKLMV